MQQVPLELQRARAQCARDDRRQLVPDRSRARLELLDALAVGIAEMLPETEHRVPQLVFAKFFLPVSREIFLGQLALVSLGGVVEQIDQLIAMIDSEPFGAADRIEPENYFVQRLDGIVRRQLGDELFRLPDT